MTRGDGHSSHRGFVQRAWTSDELVGEPSINLLETRAAHESVLALAESEDKVKLHIDIRTAATYIKHQDGTRNNVLSQEPLLLLE